jgi:integrase
MSSTQATPHRARPSGSVITIPRKSGDRRALKTRDRFGRQDKITLGPKWTGRGKPPEGFWTQKQAEERLREVLVKLGGQTAGPLDSATLGTAARVYMHYLEHDLDRAPSTLSGYRSCLNVHALPVLGADTPVGDLTADDLETLRTYLLGKLARRTGQQVMVVIHGLLGFAVRRRWAHVNVAAAVERIRVQAPTEFAILSPAEVFAVARRAEGQIGAIILLGAFTGLRIGELRALRWRDIDFAGCLIHVRRNLPHGSKVERVPKGRQARSVPLLDQAVPVLDRLSQRERFTGPDDLVFTSPTGKHLDDNPIRRGLYAAMAAAGIDRDRGTGKPFVFHDLRHSFGTLAVRVFPLTDVQTHMGHKSVETTRRYIHHVPRRDAAAKLTALVNEDVAPELVPA